MMFDPASTLVGPVTVTATSACGVTLVPTREPVAVPLLLVGFGSLVGEVADAVLMNCPLAGAVTVTV